jgi:hypothetical protein
MFCSRNLNSRRASWLLSFAHAPHISSRSELVSAHATCTVYLSFNLWLEGCVCKCADAQEDEAPPTPAEEGQAEPTGMREIHEQLATCTTSERADEIAINFCLIQTKSALPSVTIQSLEL